MTPAEAYADELGALRGLLSQPVRGIHLLEFTTIPQLEGILAEFRSVCAERVCVEVVYDPPRENPALLLDRLRQELLRHLADSIPLLILRPAALPDAAQDGPAAADFWKSLNFRRESLGALNAQILLCVDPWHYQYLVDEALDLLSWIMPKFHLIPPAELSPAREEMFSGTSAFSEVPVSPAAARSRWETFWPIVEDQLRVGPLPPSAVRRYILPLLESALATGNLVHARKVRAAAAGITIPPEDAVEWHKLNAILACGAGDAALAEDHASRLLALMETPGDDHLQKAASFALTEVSNLLGNVGRFTITENLCRHLVAYSTAAFGDEDRNTLVDRMNLANALNGQGKHVEAEKENSTVLAIQERIFGPEHPDTLGTRMNLANALDSQGKHNEAELEYRAVLASQERVLGPEHPDTLTSRNNLGNSLNSQSKHAEAEQEIRAVLAIQDRVLGPEHPATLGSRSNLANTLNYQGKHAEAELEVRALLAIRERVLGPEHPDVFGSYHNLSLCLEVQGKKPEALVFARRALAGSTKVLGEQHPDTLAAKRQVEDLEQP